MVSGAGRNQVGAVRGGSSRKCNVLIMLVKRPRCHLSGRCVQERTSPTGTRSEPGYFGTQGCPFCSGRNVFFVFRTKTKICLKPSKPVAKSVGHKDRALGLYVRPCRGRSAECLRS